MLIFGARGGSGRMAAAYLPAIRGMSAGKSRKLLERLRLLESVTVHANDAVVITGAGASGQPPPPIRYVNDAFTRMTGYRPEEVIGKTPGFLQGPLTDRATLARIGAALRRGTRVQAELLNYRKDGSTFIVELSIVPVYNAHGVRTHWVSIQRDVTERSRAETAVRRAEAMEVVRNQLEQEIAHRKRVEGQLRRAAYYDSLTNLPNRAWFLNRLTHSIAQRRRHPKNSLAVLFLDIDRFKVVNDSLGHIAGDMLVEALSRRMAGCLRPYDGLARMGGDEFAILLDGVTCVRDATNIAKRLLDSLRDPFTISGRNVFATVSIGIVLNDENYKDAETMLRNADTAMYRAKQLGGGRYEVFAAELHGRALDRLELELDLRQALERDELHLAYQPIIDLDTGRTSALEALARWRHPQRGFIPPSEFIPLAEETGLILSLGEWALDKACRQAKTWNTLGAKELSIGVNVSAKQLGTDLFAASVEAAIADSGLDARCLHLELTETALLDLAEKTTSTIDLLRSLGISVQLDDFGTGYSSLSRLQLLPIDIIKIDRSFISGPSSSGLANPEIVRAIIALGQTLGKRITAEGVESAEQVLELRALNCTSAQGYYISRPLDEDGVRALLSI